MNIVIDTNVFVSSFFGGNPKMVVDLWRTGQIKICVTNVIIEEYVEVLCRIGLKDPEKKNELLSLFRDSYFLLFTTKTPKIRLVEDPDDDKFIECAVALRADFIVSGDHHLLEIGDYMGIKILTPKEFLIVFNKKCV